MPPPVGHTPNYLVPEAKSTAIVQDFAYITCKQFCWQVLLAMPSTTTNIQPPHHFPIASLVQITITPLPEVFLVSLPFRVLYASSDSTYRL